jgi:hypothetical protein
MITAMCILGRQTTRRVDKQCKHLPNTSIDTFIKIAAAEEFLLPFFPYYAYPFTAEYYIGTADLRRVPGGRKNAW